MSKDTFLIVGLGNPGKQYCQTRHNLGFMVVDRLAELLHTRFNPGKGKYWIATIEHKARDLLLVKPTTYMNESGRAVSQLVYEFEIDLSRLLVVCDDVNLPLGKLRLRPKGSDGGHKGLASIISCLNSCLFPRLRVGIGTSLEKDQLIDYVLSPFHKDEEKYLEEVIDKACQAILSFVERGITETMNRFN